MNFRVSSEKETLIILPGWGGNEMLWQFQQKYLNDLFDINIIVITDKYRVETMAEAVLAQAPKRFHLVGHSLGGWVSQVIAINAPQRLKSLTLVDSWTGDSPVDMKAFFKEMLSRIQSGDRYNLLEELRPGIVDPVRKDDQGLMAMLAESQHAFSEEGLINQTLAEINSVPTNKFLHKIKIPTLIIQGRQDPFFSMEVADYLKTTLTNSKLAIIENCGHMPSVERPEALTALIRLHAEYNNLSS